MAPLMPLLVGLLAVEIATLVTQRLRGSRMEDRLRRRPTLATAFVATLAWGLSIVAVARLNAGFLDEALFRRCPTNRTRHARTWPLH